jgi:hypothetical protein
MAARMAAADSAHKGQHCRNAANTSTLVGRWSDFLRTLSKIIFFNENTVEPFVIMMAKSHKNLYIVENCAPLSMAVVYLSK